jgi:hypothetical protein
MKDHLRRQLEKNLTKQARETARTLLEERDAESIARGLRQLDDYQRVLAALKPSPGRDVKKAIVIAFICVLAAGLLWYLRVPRIHVLVDVHSDVVAFELNEPWQLERRLRASQMRIEYLESIRAPALGVNIDSRNGDAWIDLSGGQIELHRAVFDAGGYLEIDSGAEQMEWYFKNASLRGDLLIKGTVLLSAGNRPDRLAVDGVRQSIEVPETVHIRSGESGMIPSVVRIRPLDGWGFRDIRVNRLSFFRERVSTPGSIGFESAIRKGSVAIHETSSETDLKEGDRLVLEGVAGRLTRVEQGTALRIAFEGTVEKLLTGPEGFEHNLAPSYLEYLYVRKPLTFFWSAVVFMWGMLWSILKWIRV